MRVYRNVFSLLFLSLSQLSYADLPLTVEDLITEQGKLRMDVAVSYVNDHQKGIADSTSILIQTGPGSFVYLPIVSGEHYSISDALVGTLGLRYGITPKTEIYTLGSYLWENRRSINPESRESEQSHQMTDVWVGVSHQFKDDLKTPALLGFAELAAYEKNTGMSSSLKSALVGLTTYKAIDPIVFSLTAAYRWNRKRNSPYGTYRPGGYILLNPSVAFAVNERVSLDTGVQWLSRQADQYSDGLDGIRHTSTSFLFGVSYSPSKENMFNVRFKLNASDRNGSDLRFQWLHSF